MEHSPTEKGMNPAADGHYQIRIVRSGIGFLKTGENCFLLRPGTTYIIRPGEEKPAVMLKEGVFLNFDLTADTAALMRANAPAFKHHDVRMVPEKTLENLERLAGECREELRQQRPGSRLAVLEKQLAAERLIFQEGFNPVQTEEKIARSLGFIAENYARDVTLLDLAGPLGLSISYYRRIFRQLLGCSPIDCLLDYRLFQAGKLLAESPVSIARIAVESGFNDPNYFSRLFTRRKGMTPSRWRRLHRKN